MLAGSDLIEIGKIPFCQHQPHAITIASLAGIGVDLVALAVVHKPSAEMRPVLPYPAAG